MRFLITVRSRQVVYDHNVQQFTLPEEETLLKTHPTLVILLLPSLLCFIALVGAALRFLEKRRLDDVERKELFKDVSRHGRFGNPDWWKPTIRT